MMRKGCRRIPMAMDQEEVALLFRRYGLVAAPVVAEDERLLGVITVDDVVDVIDEEAEEDLMRLGGVRSEEHTSELQSLMRISYAVFCLKKKKTIPDCAVDSNSRSHEEEVTHR